MIAQRIPVLQGGPDAYLDFDFRFGQEAYWINRQRYGDFTLVPGATSTGGAGFGTVQRNGVWQSVPANAPLIGDGGLGVWEARTNSIRNPVMAGAVVGVIGAGGALPNNWGIAGASSGLAISIAAKGQANGLEYIDIRIAGTPSASSVYGVQTEIITQVVSSSGQTWTADGFLALVGGSITNVARVLHRVRSFTSDGSAGVEASAGVDRKAALTSSLQRFSEAVTLANASSERVNTQLLVEFTSGQPIDITLRIAAPNLKLGADVGDPPILQTSGLAATRTAVAPSVSGLVFPSAFTGQVKFMWVGAAPDAFPIALQLDDGSNSNRVAIYRSNAGGTGSLLITTAGTPLVLGFGNILQGVEYNIAFRCEAGNYAASVNGAAPVVFTNAQAVPPLNTWRPQNSFGGAINNVGNGLLAESRIIASSLNNAQLQALTA